MSARRLSQAQVHIGEYAFLNSRFLKAIAAGRIRYDEKSSAHRVAIRQKLARVGASFSLTSNCFRPDAKPVRALLPTDKLLEILGGTGRPRPTLPSEVTEDGNDD